MLFSLPSPSSMFSFLFCFFFLMIRRPPRSTLFPYTRSSDLFWAYKIFRYVARVMPERREEQRSEEHTSELQSLTNLVCRLLLEKKNKTFPMIIRLVMIGKLFFLFKNKDKQ